MIARRGKSKRSLELIDAAYDILKEIHPASVRAVCYQMFIVKRLIPSMERKYTNLVGGQLTYARKAGIIPWDWIVDETRAPEYVNAWRNLDGYLGTLKRDYRRDRWTTQPEWIEVWAEKGTIRGTIAPVLDEFGVTFRVMHGNASTTVMHNVAEETQQQRRALLALYLGDWDPSGLYMSEVDLPKRLKEHEANAKVERIALTPAEITRENLPSFPTKKGIDSLYAWFKQKSGVKAWELDSLSPVRLRAILRKEIRKRLDLAAWNLHDTAEKAELESINTIVQHWPTMVRAFQE
jgi:hypothetical protein